MVNEGESKATGCTYDEDRLGSDGLRGEVEECEANDMMVSFYSKGFR